MPGGEDHAAGRAAAGALPDADPPDAKLEAMSELLDGALPGETWLGYQKLWESNVRRTTPVKP